MPNRNLTTTELRAANDLLEIVRGRLVAISAGDDALLWALRRKVYKELLYDERGKPSHRRRLKRRKREEQDGLCAVCGEPLPERYTVLDRFEAMDGYTMGNTRLIHRHCDEKTQEKRSYS